MKRRLDTYDHFGITAPRELPADGNTMAKTFTRTEAKRRAMVNNLSQLKTNRLLIPTAPIFLFQREEDRANEASRRRGLYTLFDFPGYLLESTRKFLFTRRSPQDLGTDNSKERSGPKTQFDQSKVEKLRQNAGSFSQTTFNSGLIARRRRYL